MGTMVTNGNGIGIVILTGHGASSVMGRIAKHPAAWQRADFDPPFCVHYRWIHHMFDSDDSFDMDRLASSPTPNIYECRCHA